VQRPGQRQGQGVVYRGLLCDAAVAAIVEGEG
jgi:hypothetical protein